MKKIAWLAAVVLLILSWTSGYCRDRDDHKAPEFLEGQDLIDFKTVIRDQAERIRERKWKAEQERIAAKNAEEQRKSNYIDMEKYEREQAARHAAFEAAHAASRQPPADDDAARFSANSSGPGGLPAVPIKWIFIEGGPFLLGDGSEDNNRGRKVTLKSFDMSKTAVTVEQYAECVIKGKCTQPRAMYGHCNWGQTGRQSYPVNCVDWDQAGQFAAFTGARLPSEAEWEYAASSRGQKQESLNWETERNTTLSGSVPVCSKPERITAQGLCDMTGDVEQWVQDMYDSSYDKIPADGSANEHGFNGRVLRGYYGNWGNSLHHRDLYDPEVRFDTIGFRLARPSSKRMDTQDLERL